MLLTGLVEYAYASQQLEQRLLEQAMDEHMVNAYELEDELAEATTPADRQAGIEDEVEDVVSQEGILYVAVFDSDGAALAASGPGEHGTKDLAGVVDAVTPTVGVEDDPGESGDGNRFEFLLRVRTPQGLLVMEIDERADVIQGMLSDLRKRKVLGLLLVVVFAVPLSYLLGGRSLHRRQNQADQLADTDSLTGVAGRRPFRPALQAALSAPRAGPVALALIDIDRFKRVNDKLGHSYGDRVLVALGQSFRALRASDAAFRLGGDEFAVVIPDASDCQAAEVVERVRAALESLVPGITISCRVASVRPEEAVPLQELWERSDSALYEAGIAADLDENARRAVLRAVGAQPWRGLLFINVHPDALRHLAIDPLVADVAAAGLTPSDVVLEVTEQADLDNPDTIRTLKRADTRGFRLALDDMGQGNAGLRALTHVRSTWSSSTAR